MKSDVSSLLPLIIILDLSSVSVSSDIILIDTGDALCNKKVVVKNTFEIKIDHRWTTSLCTMTLVPHKETNTLQAFFVAYTIHKSATNCKTGAIYIYDSQENPLLGEHGYCGPSFPTARFNLGENGMITLKKSTYNNNLKARIRVVEYYVKNESCPVFTFDCSEQNLCIDKSLECELHTDCPNGHDEGAHCPKHSYTIAYILAGAGFVVVLCCVCAIYVYERSEQRTKDKYIRNST
ncbi:unnamed protein product [Lymnaea stagnalis]|uniref:CUB domain-containing protein n=1 Tax=Lymnaea stagnalis TaxID=6523 RepID=A0AAV2HHR2_LYMST